MKKLIFGLLILGFIGSISYSQNSSNSICFTTNGRNCVPVSADNPFPTSATISAATITSESEATATAANPSYSEGTSNPLSQDLSGHLRVGATQTTSPWVVSGTVAATQSGTWTVQPGNTVNITPWLVRQSDGTNNTVVNACQSVALTSTSINVASATTTRIVAPTSAKKTYLCSLFLFSAGTNNVAVVEGTGGTCGSGTTGVIGGATAVSGTQLTAQVGFVLPNTGYPQAITSGTNVDLCLITSTNTQLSGVIMWAQQ